MQVCEEQPRGIDLDNARINVTVRRSCELCSDRARINGCRSRCQIDHRLIGIEICSSGPCRDCHFRDCSWLESFYRDAVGKGANSTVIETPVGKTPCAVLFRDRFRQLALAPEYSTFSRASGDSIVGEDTSAHAGKRRLSGSVRPQLGIESSCKSPDDEIVENRGITRQNLPIMARLSGPSRFAIPHHVLHLILAGRLRHGRHISLRPHSETRMTAENVRRLVLLSRQLNECLMSAALCAKELWRDCPGGSRSSRRWQWSDSTTYAVGERRPSAYGRIRRCR